MHASYRYRGTMLSIIRYCEQKGNFKAWRMLPTVKAISDALNYRFSSLACIFSTNFYYWMPD